MLMFHDATIDTDDETAAAYEFKFGEDQPIKFPLKGVQIVHNGGRLHITVPNPAEVGPPRLTLDRIRTEEPKRATSGGKTVYSFSGASEQLYMSGLGVEDNNVAFTITKWGRGDGNVVE